MYLWERAFHHDQACNDQFCLNFYRAFAPDPFEAYAYGRAASNGIHFICGLFGCTYKVNVVGYSNHYNLTFSHSYYWHTEAKEWKCPQGVPNC
jgi:hypothetical protein